MFRIVLTDEAKRYHDWLRQFGKVSVVDIYGLKESHDGWTVIPSSSENLGVISECLNLSNKILLVGESCKLFTDLVDCKFISSKKRSVRPRYYHGAVIQTDLGYNYCTIMNRQEIGVFAELSELVETLAWSTRMTRSDFQKNQTDPSLLWPILVRYGSVYAAAFDPLMDHLLQSSTFKSLGLTLGDEITYNLFKGHLTRYEEDEAKV